MNTSELYSFMQRGERDFQEKKLTTHTSVEILWDRFKWLYNVGKS